MKTGRRQPMTRSLVPSRIAQTIPQLVAPSVTPGKTELGRAMPVPRAGEPQRLQYTATDIKTFFTVAGGTNVLYKAESWVRIRLMLRGDGLVVVGTRDRLDPIGSGAGVPLIIDQEFETVLTRGGKITIAADGIVPVGVVIEPLPWMETLSLQIGMVNERLDRISSQLDALLQQR